MSFSSYLDKSLYPSGMNVTVGTVPTPAATKSETGKPDKDPEVNGMIFEVTIDGHELGFWSNVGGLSVKFEIAEYRAGDGSNRRWIEPAYTTYSNVTLGRVTTLKHTKQIMEWLQKSQFKSKKVTAQIKGLAVLAQQA